jgi:hypothetical protein
VVDLNIKSPGSGLVIDDLLVVVNLGRSSPLLVLEISKAALAAGAVVPMPTDPEVVTLVTEEFPNWMLLLAVASALYPKAVALYSEPEDTSAPDPMNVFSLPETLLYPAWRPMAVLFDARLELPDTFDANALKPTAVLYEFKLLSLRLLMPTATLPTLMISVAFTFLTPAPNKTLWFQQRGASPAQAMVCLLQAMVGPSPTAGTVAEVQKFY